MRPLGARGGGGRNRWRIGAKFNAGRTCGHTHRSLLAAVRCAKRAGFAVRYADGRELTARDVHRWALSAERCWARLRPLRQRA